VGAHSSLKAFHVERNRVLVLVKLFPLSLVLASPLFTTWRLALQAWAAASGRGAAGRLAARSSSLHLAVLVARAYASAAVSLPRALRERWRFRRRRRLTTPGFLRLLARHRLGAREVALKD
jgi:hypothetical protein